MNTVESVHAIIESPPDVPSKNKCDTIFIIDDDYFTTGLLEVALSERGYGNVVTFENPLDALAKIKNGSTPALVITDFFMPELNGVELLREIEKINPNIPGIIMTSKPSAAKLLSPKWEIIKKCEFAVFVPMIEGKIGNIMSTKSSN